MKRGKLTSIILLVIIGVMLITFTGCNYVNRPDGAKNNSADNSARLAQLLVKDQLIEKEVQTQNTERVPVDDETPDEPADEPDDDENQEPDDDENQEPDDDENQEPDDDENQEPDEPAVSASPFDAPGDVLGKITEILGSLSAETIDATSSTGVKDELMTSRTVKVYLPYTIYDGMDESVAAIAGNLNMNINTEVVVGDYIKTLKSKVLAGEKSDLMYVDQQSWGSSQHFTQDITQFVNFDIADELGTFSSMLTEKFTITLGEEKKNFVASGIGAPYLLIYDKNNIVVPDKTIPANEETSEPELKIEDPITMFNAGTWGVSPFQEIIYASTTGNRVGLASLIDDPMNYDLWMGMENNASLVIDYNSLTASVDASVVSREALDSVGDNMDLMQKWYWDTISEDYSNYIAAWVDNTDDAWDTTVEKVFGSYSGQDSVSSYSFFTVELDDYATVKAAADKAGADFDFVGYPHGRGTEILLRTTAPDSEGVVVDGNGVVVKPFSAGWIGGFSVLKNCENPAVALRVAEEITKAWKSDYEAPIVSQMTEDQQARYAKMKENIGISFYSSVVHNAETAFPVYGSDLSERLDNITRNAYTSLQMFSDSVKEDGQSALTQPMYRKHTSIGPYDANTFNKWSEYYYGKIDENENIVSRNILPILSAAYVPPTMLFIA